MSISDRLDQIEGRNLSYDVDDLLDAVRSVLDVCDGLEEAHRANPEQMYEYGLEEAAHQVRNAVEAALGEES